MLDMTYFLLWGKKKPLPLQRRNLLLLEMLLHCYLGVGVVLGGRGGEGGCLSVRGTFGSGPSMKSRHQMFPVMKTSLEG